MRLAAQARRNAVQQRLFVDFELAQQAVKVGIIQIVAADFARMKQKFDFLRRVIGERAFHRQLNARAAVNFDEFIGLRRRVQRFQRVFFDVADQFTRPLAMLIALPRQNPMQFFNKQMIGIQHFFPGVQQINFDVAEKAVRAV